LLPDEVGFWDSQLIAENAYGSDIYDFQVEVTYVPPPPM
jgi:hypothetical protein